MIINKILNLIPAHPDLKAVFWKKVDPDPRQRRSGHGAAALFDEQIECLALVVTEDGTYKIVPVIYTEDEGLTPISEDDTTNYLGLARGGLGSDYYTAPDPDEIFEKRMKKKLAAEGDVEELL